ncbi:MAG: DUF2726 domain-containing protein [bacterium]|nr:DUF2726 domain-containing protein [Mycoplasmatota bacterium]MDD6756747.1 DUF2726 domain-containing protein [bacterium]MDY2908709.1 DUF2726 domain-containing protein [Candidatus Faecimonas sp.]
MYEQKEFMSYYEKYFYDILKDIERDYDVIVQPQVNLASVIEKNIKHKYVNELFRNIDFGIFDKNFHKLLLAIEINDSSHLKKDRIIRDLKVEKILNQANIKLIKFYTNMPNEKLYVTNRILTYLDLLI